VESQHELSQSALDGLSAHIAVLDCAGTILSVNEGWRRFARSNGLAMAEDGVGINYLTICETATGDSSDGAREAGEKIREIIDESSDEAYLEYPCHSPDEDRWFAMRATRIGHGERACVVVAHEEITERRAAERTLRDRTHQLAERVKELNCLHGISRLGERPGLELPDLIRGIADLIPPAWQYPEITAARVVVEDHEYRTASFTESPWQQTSDIVVLGGKVGFVQVCYLEEMPEESEGPFLREERSLLGDIAGRLGEIIARRRFEEALRLSESRLSSLLDLSQRAHGLSETEIVREAIECAVSLTDSAIGYLHFVNPDQKSIQLVAWSEETAKQCTAVYESHYPLEEAGVWADCVRLGRPVVHNDYQSLQQKKGYPEGHAHLVRHASTPVYDEDRIRLILGVGNKERDYDSMDLLQMTLVGDQLVRILERKRAEADLQEANSLLEVRVREIEKLQAELREQAVRDYLTGLFNRRYLEETLERELSRARRGSVPLSVVIIDIDRFKEINDSYGHSAGDAVLEGLGAMLAADSRASDIACRYGGDEFVVVMPGASIGDALRRAEGWRRKFAKKAFVFDGERCATTLSMGVAAFPAHGSSVNGLLQAADQALYRSKVFNDRVSVSPRSPTVGFGPVGEGRGAAGRLRQLLTRVFRG
jgi:diguanylate cyclase (GGDEF)-like protein